MTDRNIDEFNPFESLIGHEDVFDFFDTADSAKMTIYRMTNTFNKTDSVWIKFRLI